MRLGRRLLLMASVGVAAALLGPPVGLAAPIKFKRLSTVNGTSAQAVAIVRSADGVLHLAYQTFAGRAFDGLAAMSISKFGQAGPQVQALAGWQAGQPGLVVLPDGTLEAVFGAISPGLVSSVWGITSSNGGLSWSAPADVRGGGPNEALAYGSDITAAMSAGTPVLTLPQAGNIVIQTGLGGGSPGYQLTNASNGSTTDADLAVDAASGEVVAGWPSGAGTLSDYLQGAAPTIGAPQQVPGQYRTAVVVAGRDKGPGVFAAYTSDATHVRLVRYGGGTVAVGSLHGVTAKRLGVATGVDGRMWVMWGDDSGGGLAVTRSNKAVTRFEPIQHLNPDAFTLYRISGDGRRGPLDLLVDEIPNSKASVPPPGDFYARVLPELSAKVSASSIKNKTGKVIAHELLVTVTDAGDAVSGATASAKGQQKKTNAKGVAKLTLTGSSAGPVTITISAPGYQALNEKVTL